MDYVRFMPRELPPVRDPSPARLLGQLYLLAVDWLPFSRVRCAYLIVNPLSANRYSHASKSSWNRSMRVISYLRLKYRKRSMVEDACFLLGASLVEIVRPLYFGFLSEKCDGG